MQTLDKSVQRNADIFIQWSKTGHITQNWHLHMRHPAIAALLVRAIDPSEGNFPFSAIIPLLKNLSTKEEDLWLAGGLSYRLGQYFKRLAGHFSLDTDTSAQRAARAIFSAIPESIKAVSRTVRHHQGRYHLHVLRACCECISKPHLTTLKPNEVVVIAKQEHKKASDFMKMAIEIRSESDPLSYIYNTLATTNFTLAEILKNKEPLLGQTTFDDALDYEDLAIKYDPANGHALFQFIQRILKTLESNAEINHQRQQDLLILSESRLMELNRLHCEKRWRNIDPIEAEKQLGSLFQDHFHAVKKLVGTSSSHVIFQTNNVEAEIFLRIRMMAKNSTIEQVFLDPSLSVEIRKFRDKLLAIPNRTTRSDIYLYRLFLSDNIARASFNTRLKILQKIKREDPDQFMAFRHDEGALYCQLNQLDIGEQKLREVREFRSSNRTQWFWLNEKALLDPEQPTKAREMVLQVTDPTNGWAIIRNTDIRIKYQPYHFGEKKRQEVFKSFIRFTLNGLQAVTEKLIKHDLEEMGLE